MTAIVLLGAGTGLGLWLVWRALTARPALTEIAATLATPGRAVKTTALPAGEQLDARLARQAVALLTAAGIDPSRRASDLRVIRRSVEAHVLAKLTWAVTGAVSAVIVAGGLLRPAAAVVVLLAAALGTGGFLLPERGLTRDAEQARAGFRHALGAYLDLVTVMEAGGSGPETALYTAAEAGDGWAFTEIRSTLEGARRTRRSSWDALAELGRELDIAELSELAASLTLVEHQGARIRASLQAKADAMRAQQLADAKAEAGSTTERMTLPVVLTLLSFLVFIAFPAAARIGQVGSP